MSRIVLSIMFLTAVASLTGCEPEPRHGSISGLVTIDGQPAAGIRVTLSNGDTTVTDADGTYWLPISFSDSYDVTISGYDEGVFFEATTKSTYVTLKSDSIDDTLEEETRKESMRDKIVNFAGITSGNAGGNVVGVVTCSKTGALMVGVTIRIGDSTCTTDSSGRYDCEVPQAGTYDLSATGSSQHHDYTASVTVETGATTEHNIVMQAK